MAAGLPKTLQRVKASSPALAWSRQQGAWARAFVQLSLWKRRFRRFLCSIYAVSFCSLVVYQRQPDSLVARHLDISQIANRASSGVNIVCLGDSLTQGIGATKGHDYPSLLSQVLGRPVINAGVDGDETADALKRLESDVLAKDPRVVIVELGANDFLDKQPLEQAFENLDEIVRRIESHGAMVVLVGLAPGSLGDALQPSYDAIINKYHVAFVPKVLDDVITNPTLKSNDHLHPNDRGYALIGERIERVVIPLLQQLKAVR